MGCIATRSSNIKVSKAIYNSPLNLTTKSGIITLTDKENLKLADCSFVLKLNEDAMKNYIIHCEIGQGSYGKVFKVEHIKRKKFFALKIISKEKLNKSNFNETSYLKEIEILKKLDHPHIIKIYEYLIDERNIYIITELCSNGDLYSLINKHGLLDNKLIKNVMKQLFSTVFYLHSNKIVHRDIKLQNILIENPDTENFSIKLIDFGISTLIENQENLSDSIGTVLYVAPEVISKSYNEKIDLWSCGVIMYFLSSLSFPFKAETDRETIKLIRNGYFSLNNDIWNNVNADAKDLIRNLLDINYHTRISAESALKHRYFSDLELSDLSAFTSINSGFIAENLINFKAEKALQRFSLKFIARNLFSNQQYEQITKIFKYLDKNGDGRLSKEEISEVFKNVLKLEKTEINKIFRLLDVDENGFIDYIEFVTANLKHNILEDENLVKEIFAILDLNKDGKISDAELKSVLSDGIRHNRSFWLSIIADADLDRDGKINYDEFKTLLCRVK